LATSKNGGGRVSLKAAPNQLGAKSSGDKSADDKSGLLGVQSVGVQNIVKNVEAPYAQPGLQNQIDKSDNPPSGPSLASSVILACTLTLFVVLLIAFVARKTLANRGRSQYQPVPEMTVLVDNRTPRYT
jgi:hypothetical protein